MRHYGSSGFIREQELNRLQNKIDLLTDSMTLENQSETLRKIGTLQIKIEAIKQTNVEGKAIDWHVKIAEQRSK